VWLGRKHERRRSFKPYPFQSLSPQNLILPGVNLPRWNPQASADGHANAERAPPHAGNTREKQEVCSGGNTRETPEVGLGGNARETPVEKKFLNMSYQESIFSKFGFQNRFLNRSRKKTRAGADGHESAERAPPDAINTRGDTRGWPWRKHERKYERLALEETREKHEGRRSS
jgi:hypothetical protein